MTVYATPDEVVARLRLPAGHPDTDYVALCTDVANERITDWLLPADVAAGPASLHRAAIGVAIRVYRFKDAESDVSDTWGETSGLRIPRDPLAGYYDLLAPYRAGAAWAPPPRTEVAP